MSKYIDLVLEKLGFRMMNEDKVERVINGMATSRGLIDGVGEDASPEVILAKYDAYHGYITKNGYKVKQGLFYDQKTYNHGKGSCVPVNPKGVVLLIQVNGEFVEFKESDEKTPEVQVAMKQHEAKETKKTKKSK